MSAAVVWLVKLCIEGIFGAAEEHASAGAGPVSDTPAQPCQHGTEA